MWFDFFEKEYFFTLILKLIFGYECFESDENILQNIGSRKCAGHHIELSIFDAPNCLICFYL